MMTLRRPTIRTVAVLGIFAQVLSGQWTTSGSNITAASGTHVGIGTSSPGNSLDIQDTGATVLIANPSGQGLYLGQWDGTQQYISSFYPGHDSMPLKIQASVTTVSAPSAQTYPLQIADGALKAQSGKYVGILLRTADTSNPLTGSLTLFTDPTAANRHMMIAAREDGVGWMNLVMMGKVGIGTILPPQSELAVNGVVTAKEVVVTTSGWSDYVFDQNYALTPLAQVAAFIQKNRHLPGIPSAAEVAENGVPVGEMQAKLLAKIEELTLHVIEQQRQIDELKTLQGTRK